MRDILDKYKDNNDLTDDQVAEIKSQLEKLQTGAQQVFTKMYEAAQQAAAAQQAGGTANQAGADTTASGDASDDGVVDADFKEV